MIYACCKCSCLVQIDDEQERIIRALAVTSADGATQCIVPILEWQFTVWDGDLLAICPEHVKTLPPWIAVTPVMPPGLA